MLQYTDFKAFETLNDKLKEYYEDIIGAISMATNEYIDQIKDEEDEDALDEAKERGQLDYYNDPNFDANELDFNKAYDLYVDHPDWFEDDEYNQNLDENVDGMYKEVDKFKSNVNKINAYIKTFGSDLVKVETSNISVSTYLTVKTSHFKDDDDDTVNLDGNALGMDSEDINNNDDGDTIDNFEDTVTIRISDHEPGSRLSVFGGMDYFDSGDVDIIIEDLRGYYHY